MSHHSMIYCTKQISKIKYSRHKKSTFHSLKSYSIDVYEETLERVSFPNNKNFDNPDIVYSDFITTHDCAINTIDQS